MAAGFRLPTTLLKMAFLPTFGSWTITACWSGLSLAPRRNATPGWVQMVVFLQRQSVDNGQMAIIMGQSGIAMRCCA
jgi:hypothetical protein